MISLVICWKHLWKNLGHKYNFHPCGFIPFIYNLVPEKVPWQNCAWPSQKNKTKQKMMFGMTILESETLWAQFDRILRDPILWDYVHLWGYSWAQGIQLAEFRWEFDPLNFIRQLKSFKITRKLQHGTWRLKSRLHTLESEYFHPDNASKSSSVYCAEDSIWYQNMINSLFVYQNN